MQDTQLQQEQRLDLVTRGAQEVLFSVQTVFPFKLFPDTVSVTKDKVEIVYSYFFFSKQVFSILLIELSTVEVETNPFFASMRFEVQGYEKNPEIVRFLPKDAALRLQSTIIGLMSAKKQGVQVEQIPREKLRPQAERIGSVQPDPRGM